MNYRVMLTKLKERENQKAWSRDNRVLLMTYLNEVLEDANLSEKETFILNRLFRKYTVGQIVECIDIGAEQYLDVDTKNNLTVESIEKFLDKLGGILYIRYGKKTGKQTLPPNQTQVTESIRIDGIHTAIDIAVKMISSFADYVNTVFAGLKAIAPEDYSFDTEIPIHLSYFAVLLLNHIEMQIDAFDDEEAGNPEIFYTMCTTIPPELGTLYSDTSSLPSQNGIYNPGFWIQFCRVGEFWLDNINFSTLNVKDKTEGNAIKNLTITKIREKYGNII